jgi:hypothetical protein
VHIRIVLKRIFLGKSIKLTVVTMVIETVEYLVRTPTRRSKWRLCNYNIYVNFEFCICKRIYIYIYLCNYNIYVIFEFCICKRIYIYIYLCNYNIYVIFEFCICKRIYIYIMEWRCPRVSQITLYKRKIFQIILLFLFIFSYLNFSFITCFMPITTPITFKD